MNTSQPYDNAFAESLPVILRLIEDQEQSKPLTAQDLTATDLACIRKMVSMENGVLDDDRLDKLMAEKRISVSVIRLACCRVLVSLHDKPDLYSALRTFMTFEWAGNFDEVRPELQKILGVLDSRDIQTLLRYFSIDDMYTEDHLGYTKLHALLFETIVKISEKDASVLPSIQSDIQECLSSPRDFQPSGNARMIQLACYLNFKELSPLIEKAFAKNSVDTAVCGDWSVVRERLGVQGQGLAMPAKPLNLAEQRKLDSGVCIFSDVPLFVDSELDDEAYASYEEKACSSFVESQEWMSLNSPHKTPRYLETFLHAALLQLGLNVENMSTSGLSELMMDYFPQKVTMKPDEAPELIDELIAFWSFCHRVHHLEFAKSNVDWLKKNRQQFHREMANSDNYGIAKSLMRIASEAGYNIESAEDLNEFMEDFSAGLVGGTAGFFGAAQSEPRYSPAGPIKRAHSADNHRVDSPAITNSLAPPRPLKERKKLLAKLKKRK